MGQFAICNVDGYANFDNASIMNSPKSILVTGSSGLIRSEGSGVRRPDGLFVVLLIVLGCCFSYLQWSKIPSFWGDSARWMFETYRVFQGDAPYRDIASLYPPLSLYTFAAAYKVFGQTFGTAQMLV